MEVNRTRQMSILPLEEHVIVVLSDAAHSLLKGITEGKGLPMLFKRYFLLNT